MRREALEVTVCKRQPGCSMEEGAKARLVCANSSTPNTGTRNMECRCRRLSCLISLKKKDIGRQRKKQQCKERYRLADTVAELTFVFIRVIFLGSPAFRSSLVLTKVTDSADSARPIHYSTFDESPPFTTPSLSPTSSLTHVHRCIGSHDATRQTLPTSAKLTHLRVYDSRDDVSEHTASPSTPSSLTHVHRCIGSRNATRQTLPTSAKLTSLSMYGSRDGVSEHAASSSPPSSLTHVHRYIGSHNTTRQMLSTSVK